jgi:hypothetical protein
MDLRFTIARAADRSMNPFSGETENRDLFYATLVSIQGPNDTSDTTATVARPTRILVKGPAVPHFAPPPEVVKAGNANGKINFSSSSSRHVSEESEIRDAKEKAMSLLMARMESMVHTELARDGQIEVWDSKSWKHAESNGKEESVRSLKRGSTRGSAWFSKD